MESYKHLALLGCGVKDRVTGIVGFVEGITYDLYGCVQAEVIRPVKDDGKPNDNMWFDVNRLELVRPSINDTHYTVGYFADSLKPLGLACVDKATGMKGTITSIYFAFSGNRLNTLNAGLTDKGEVIGNFWLQPIRMQLGERVMQCPNWEFGPQAEGKQGCAERPA